ncbi:hypothetical protein [Amycolatopsis vancoresmycina]|uniref:Uncharacterized protein n=1 Tax=Amycolatopsis vancoresmycina DSM 44592 TaxID=1292037 RepID=R1IA19_9PSEU|nr:hypothetical protein [Amycolatopsis vancoresmycina]EOD69376.1 hypothetical protein H480_06503 [Amycolatopsis vancoresmycina DSM 44592]
MTSSARDGSPVPAAEPEYAGFLSGSLPGGGVEQVFTVVRRHHDVEEVYVRDGWWAPSNRLRDLERGAESLDRYLPLGEDEAERVTARLPRSRCFLVDDGQDTPSAVVHLDGGTERIFGRDLEWRTAVLREELAGHPHLTVREITPGQELVEAYHLARRVRQLKQRHEWGGERWYFGIYETLQETFDVGATSVLVMTRAGDPWFGERYAGRGRWEPTGKLDRIWRGRSYDDELALSPAEAEAIMKRLG